VPIDTPPPGYRPTVHNRIFSLDSGASLDEMLGPLRGWPWLDTVTLQSPDPLDQGCSYQFSWTQHRPPPALVLADITFLSRQFTGPGITEPPPRQLILRFSQHPPYRNPFLRTSVFNNHQFPAAFQITALIWLNNSYNPRDV